MPRQKLVVTRRQAELAQAKVEADRALHREPDPFLVMIADAAGAPARLNGHAPASADRPRPVKTRRPA